MSKSSNNAVKTRRSNDTKTSDEGELMSLEFLKLVSDMEDLIQEIHIKNNQNIKNLS